MAAPQTPPAATLDLTDPQALWSIYGETAIAWTLNLATAIAILILGLWVAGSIRKFIRRRAETMARIDVTLASFFASVIYYIMVAFVVIAVLGRFGVETTSLVAVLGAATLAVGLALQGTLGNVASGVMTILFRPYKIGDFIEIAGKTGTVKDISLFTTELATVDNVKIIVPNGQAWGQVVVNYSSHSERRVDLTFSVSYDDDIQAVRDLIVSVAKADPRVLTKPDGPWVHVVNLAASSVDLQLRVWVKAADYWDVRFDAIKAVKEAFDAAGVEIPYPHHVEIEKDAKAKKKPAEPAPVA